ncbi:adenylate/guanylate cyclase domain-containing protein [Terrabacter sp. MAHUQ-38]|uniref:adenylate/guanylate cyclase domain-containing protein n=1 Tax=unclassified Terrabacter TaxID=2630222 RepID=UPI00165DC1FF|nr:adenylate/guanylate cyclase domain-containing protein [Terrabacter sp. MAHUQ-38]
MAEHATVGPRAPAPTGPGHARAGARRRGAVGAAALALPLLGLVLLRLSGQLDRQWQHESTHFWIVLGAALLSAVTAYGTGAAAVRRGDVRVMYVSLAFLSSAGFLGLHALATPRMLLETASAGFNVSTPVGIAIGSLFAVASVREVDAGRAVEEMRRARWSRVALILLMVAWAVVSLLRLPPFDVGPGLERGSAPMAATAVLAVVLFAVAAVTYARLWWHRGGLLPAAMASAMVLLAEAMVAIVFAPNWHYSWWEWHLLMLAAFVLVAWGAQQSWHEERYAALYTADTLAGRREMTILFADLKSFTTFSEGHDPAEVTAMLNAYFTVAIPAVVKRHGGTIDRLIGDAIMATFNRLGDQPDHARRAAQAGLDLQTETARIADEHPGWPRFRVGINSGEVLVSVLGSEGGRTHTVIGDAVNVASRIEGQAPVGRVAVTADTLTMLPGAMTEPLGPLDLKGKGEPVEAFVLLSLPDDHS